MPPQEPQREHPLATAGTGLQNTLAMFLQYKNQQDALQAQRDAKMVDLAKASEEGGEDFWRNYAAIRAGKNPYGTGIPAAAPTPVVASAPQVPAATPMSTPADPYSHYSGIQDPFGPLPGMAQATPASPPPQMSMATPADGSPAAPAGPQSTTDITPEYLAQIRRQKGSRGLKEFTDQQTFLQNQKQGAAQLGQIVTQNENSLRDDYSKANEPFRVQAENMGTLSRLAKTPGTPASDMSLMVSYMKVLNPGIQLKEGQYARLEDTAGIPDKVRDIYNSLVEGKSLRSLTQTQRDQFINAAANVYQGAYDRYKSSADVYTGIAQRQKLNPQNVVIPYEMQGFDIANYPQVAAAPTPAPRPAPGGGTGMVRVTSPDGKVGSIPRANLSRAISQGYKVVTQ